MLAKKYKLPIQLFPGKRGKLLKNANFTLKIFPAERSFSRFGVTVSSKTASKATRRNELKRAAFNFFQKKGSGLAVADYWLTILPPAVSLSKESFVSELESVLDTKF